MATPAQTITNTMSMETSRSIKTKALSILKFDKSVCEPDSDSRRKIRERIIAKEFTPKAFKVRIGARAICCADFRPIIKLNEGILFLDIEDTQKVPPCECGCFYQFSFWIKGLQTEPLEIWFKNKRLELSRERYVTHPPKFRLINSDTVDYMDKYGLKQGKWITTKKWSINTDLSFIQEFSIYKDGLVFKEIVLNEFRRVEVETIYEILKEPNRESYSGERKTIIEYYPSGAKRKECIMNIYTSKAMCKEWNEKGDLIREED